MDSNPEEKKLFQRVKCMPRETNSNEDRVQDMMNIALALFQGGQLSDAISQLKQAEAISRVNSHQIMIKTNIGVVFYAMGWLENAFTNFEDVILVIKEIKQSHQLSELRVRCYLQCCIILSEIGQHHEALAIARIAMSKSFKLLIQMHENSSPQIQSLIQMILAKNHAMLSNNQLKLVLQLQNQRAPVEDIFNNIPQEQISGTNILSLLQIQIIETLKPITSQEQELLHAISLLIASLYCSSTESRFMDNNKDPEAFSEAENYLSRALEIAYLYLPKNMPIVGQLITVHQKFHGIAKQIIHEDSKIKESNFDIVLLKPVIDVNRAAFMVPVIRKYQAKNAIRERTRSLKEVVKKKIVVDTEFKLPKKRNRSISTSHKSKPQSPSFQAGEVYLNQARPHIRKPQMKQNTINMTNTSKFFCEPKKNLNINFLIINNMNHINISTTKKKGSFNFEPVQLKRSDQKKFQQRVKCVP